MLQARLYFLIAAVVALGGFFTWGGHRLYAAGYDAAVVERAKDAQLIEAAGAAAQKAAAEAISAIQVHHVTIRQKLEKELTRDVVYRDCVASPGVFELSNEALTGRSNPAPNSDVPPAEPTL